MRRWDIIGELIESRGWQNGVELGVLKGDTLLRLAKRFPYLNITGVDIWKEFHGKPQDQMDYFETVVMEGIKKYNGRIKILKMDTVLAALEFADKSLDYVFIDADHSYESVRSEINAWLPKVKSGGYMMGHDYHHERFPGVTEAVDEKFGSGVSEFSDYCWGIEIV